MIIKRHTPYVLFLTILLTTLITHAQKKYLGPEEYNRWTSLQRTTLSDDGNWVSYNLSNEHIYKSTKNDDFRDTLELVELKSLRYLAYPFGSNPKFSNNSKWFTFLQNKQWVKIDLKTIEEKRLDSVASYEQLPNGMFSLLRKQNKPKSLELVDHHSLKSILWDDVISYTLHPDGKSVLLYQKENDLFRLLLINTEKPNSQKILKDKLQSCSQFRWSNSGEKLAFYEEAEKAEYQNQRLHVLTINNPFKNTFLESSQLPKGYYLNSHAVTFTESENKLNFVAFPIDESHTIIDPLIWQSNDPIQPPVENTYNKRMLTSWELMENKLLPICDKPYLMTTGDLEHFFWLDDSKYLPSFKHGAFFFDIIYKNGKTGEIKVIQEKFRTQDRLFMLSASPIGRYIAWNQDNDWWIYDVDKDLKKCITCGSDENFSMDFDTDNNPFKPYGPAYFSTDNHSLTLTSKNKIWKYDLKNESLAVLMENRKEQVRYTLLINNATNSLGTNYLSFRKNPIDYKKGFFIKEYNIDTNEEILFYYEAYKKPYKVVSSQNSISFPTKSNSNIIYTLKDFNLPPQLMLSNTKKSKTIRISNEQQKNYYWGHAELLTYKGPFGTNLKGTLFYPGNYNPNKKYPVILSIYSNVALRYLKSYDPPTLENSVGFNTTLFTTQDYFVFMPDIEYQTNHTGQSALQSVLAGIEALRKYSSIDITKMGIFGHSFGGYEVSYIATQTDMFKAIVSFAGWHDLVDTYNTIDDNRTFNFFRFEYHQLRITAPYYSEMFLQNSPILQANKINTPILLIAGNQDRRVYWENSMKMQLALTRFGKESTFLLYNDESHVLENKKHQIDASTKIIKWYDYHLKKGTKPAWN